ncbi:ABC transporter ATP-binding protein [Massilia antarctica]|uniref:ABC transporter ATP-binding protein n=1 Tax=Massilia antarctica TaxID=2765360 RepID=A0AA48WIL3_9BURK|nr:ABC transporter ATP-binding protein [Massilia antarctica]QPI52408.1 ABC transporter ATP-binding protein [Massilia antarctica]
MTAVKATPFSLVRQRVVRRWAVYGCGFLAILLANLCESLIPKFIQWTLDLLLGQESGAFWKPTAATADKPHTLILLALALLLVVICSLLFKFSWRMILFKETHLVGHELKKDLWASSLSMPLSGKDGLRFGDLMNRISNDWNRARIIHGYTVANSVDYVVLVAMSLVYMVNIHAKLCLILMSPLLLLPIISVELGRLQQARFLTAQETLSRLYETIAHSIKSVRLQRATATEPFWLHKLDQSARAYAEQNYRCLKVGDLNVAMSFLPYFVSLVILFSYGIVLVRDGDISIGAYISLHVYMMVIHDVISDFGSLLAEWRMGFTSYRRLFDVLHSPGQAPPALPHAPQRDAGARPAIEVEQLTFGYAGSAPLVRALSFDVSAGQKIAVIGRVGTGKTTLATLLAGGMDEYSGTIRINGRDLKDASRSWLDSQITLVHQKSLVLGRSIRVNLDPLEQFSDEVLIDSLKVVELWDEIAGLSKGLSEALGEGGGKLSGGQRQRLCLARAIIRDTPVIILDDCLGAIDPTTEKIIVERLWNIWTDKIVIFITHRAADLDFCDGVLQLDAPVSPALSLKNRAE